MSEVNRQAVMAYLTGTLNTATSQFAVNPTEANLRETQKLQAALATAHQLRPAEFEQLVMGPMKYLPDAVLKIATEHAENNGQMAPRGGTLPPTKERPELSGTTRPTMPPKRPDGDRKDAGVLLSGAKPAVPDEAEVKRIEDEIAAAADRAPGRSAGLSFPAGGDLAGDRAEGMEPDPNKTEVQSEEIGQYGRGS